MLDILDSKLKESTSLQILRSESNYVSMLITTEKSYIYGEKFYKIKNNLDELDEDNKLISSLTIEIFKEQSRTEVNYDYVNSLIFSNFVEYNEFDEREFLKTLRKNKIFFHRWYQKDGVVDTNTHKI